MPEVNFDISRSMDVPTVTLDLDPFARKSDVDTIKNDLISVQTTQPTSQYNKLWIKDQAETEYTVPTYAEFEDVKDTVDNTTHQIYAYYNGDGQELDLRSSVGAPDELMVGDILVVVNESWESISGGTTDVPWKPFTTLIYKGTTYSVTWLGDGLPPDAFKQGLTFTFVCSGSTSLKMISNSNNGRGTDKIEFTGSVSMGRRENSTIGTSSTALGRDVLATGSQSYAEGSTTEATGAQAHAEGYSTHATGKQAHAEGNLSFATGDTSHAEGAGTSASGGNSHAEGSMTYARGVQSHAEGMRSEANGMASHAEGMYTIASHRSQHTGGEYNVNDPSTNEATERGTYAEIIGNGTGSSAKSNARTLDWDGNERLKGDIYVGCNADSSNGTALGAAYTELKSAFDESVLDTIKVPYAPDFSIVAGGVSSSGENNTLATRSRTGYIDIKPGKTYCIHLNSTSYIFQMCWTYSAASTSNKVRKVETPNKNIIVIKAGTNDKKVRFCFADSDTTVTMTDSDRTAIASALKLYELTDETFTMVGTPADAKKTMDEITALQNTVITRIESIEEATEKLPYGLGIIRNGTVFNEGNTNAIATKDIIPTKNADYIIAYCNVPLTTGHKYRFQFSTFSIEDGDANDSEAYCIRKEIAIFTTDTYCLFSVDKTEKGVAYAIFERDENDTNVQLRVETFDVSKIYTEIDKSICGMNYVIGADYIKKPVAIHKIGRLTYRQSFCKYNGNYYSVDDQGHISVQDSTFTETASATLSVGHGNAFQLGNNGYAYISGWNDHKVYKIDLSTLTIADTITLPTSSGRTGAVVDDVNGIAYIFQTQSDTASTSENYNFIVYDYVNGEVLRTTKTTVAFGAMQACDYADDKIPLLNGKPSGSLTNGLRIYDTNGKIIAKYILGEFADVEMEGIFVDRDNGDLYISDTNRYVYIVSNA